MSIQEMRGALARQIAAVLAHPRISADDVVHDFTSPPGLTHGHLALPCFRLAKILDRPSQDVARSLVDKLPGGEFRATASGPYANFKWDVPVLYRRTLDRVFAEKEAYGSDASGSGQTVVLEYGSPNIARPLQFSHLRSTLLGNTLANTYAFLGHRTERICFIGDWGGQFARLLAAVELWGDKELIAQGGPAAINHLNDLQNRFQKAMESDSAGGSHSSAYAERAARCKKLLEERDPKTSALWRQLRDICLAGVEATLRRLNIRFDHLEGESAYLEGIAELVEEVKTKAGARASEGAWIVDVEGAPAPALIQKKDGTTLYFTRDLAAALDRHHRFRAQRSYYVVSEQQKLHFQLLFGVLGKMGHAWAGSCEHIAFGKSLFPEEKKSATLDQIIDEARERALEEILRKNPELPDKEGTAEKVGLAALVCGELATPRAKDVEFQWDPALATDGDTGPYVLYACVRCRALCEKAAGKGENVVEASDPPAGYVFGPEEESLILQIARFGAALHGVTHDNEPSQLVQYLIELAKTFNRFYYRFPVLQAGDTAQRRMRLGLVAATGQTLSNGLRLLGIDCPRQM